MPTTPSHVVTATLAMAGLALALVCSASLGAQTGGDGPRYANGTNLVFPDDYREWTFLSSGLSMTYEDEGDGSETGLRVFQNVFVNPSSYRGFMETGTWPNETVFVLELRRAGTEASINQAGRFQTDLIMLEAEVKDSRFEDGWAFFDLGPANALRETAAPLSGERVARCIECHTDHAAVERTFVQFYPTLLEVAKAKGTLKPGH